jgi:RND superfamily putative drug exporter
MISRDGRSAVWIVTADAEASSKQTRQLVKQIREEVLPSIDKSFKGSVAGDTAIGMDYDEVVLGSFPVVIGSVLLLTFLLLYASFRSVLLPLKAIAMNLFVTGSTLGFVVLMYQFGYMPGAEAFPLNINTPLTLFVLLFGLSMDYEVILISRMKERYEATGEHEESIVNGISSTAGMVNGAASIMVVVFGVFLFADFQLIQELGVGLAFAIFVDAWLVRSVLVPVLMKLLGHGNWWGFRAWTNFLIHGKAPSDVTAAKGGVQEGHGLY